MLALLALAGCKPAPESPELALQPVPRQQPLPVQADKPVLQGRVRIQGDDALAGDLSWSLPDVRIDTPRRARAAALRALARGDLFETPQSAIPLLLALRKLQPEDARDARLLEQARLALLAQARVALAASEDTAALRYAQRMASVLRVLWPDLADVQVYLADVDRAGQAFDLCGAGAAALRAGRLDVAGGALEAFRRAQALWPGPACAPAGLAAVEQALMDGALQRAVQGDFDGAYRQVARADAVRHDPATVPAARTRIEAIRADRIRRLGDEGLMALGDADLQYARERLAEILRIARPGDQVSVALRERIDLVSHYGLFRPGQVFSDALESGGRGPSLVVVPHGRFQMGASTDAPDARVEEQPRHWVQFQRGFAIGRFEVTVAEFRRFVDATGYQPRATQRGHSMVYDVRSGNFLRASGVDWRSGFDGRPAADHMPVLHVTARDAEAYAAWLSVQTGAHYRLPSEAEFEYVLRAGGSGRYPWGDGAPPPGVGNLAGSRDVSPQGRHWSNAFPGYGDGWWGPAPVGSFTANAFGVHDMVGNVGEWVADCWHKGYRRAPSNGAAWVNPGCRNRLHRGGAWSSAPVQVRSAWRTSGGVDITNARVGFRVARQL